jgi:signal transduction histidine kinase
MSSELTQEPIAAVKAEAVVAPRPLRILLVEDNSDDALLLERHLRRNGFVPTIERVETGPEMLVALESLPYLDLILADYNLPEFSGPAALQILRASGIDIPFIMLSGVMTETTAVESMRAGAQDYVTKQNLSRLVPAVERELREAADRRKKLDAERALQASEDRFHRLVEAMPLGLLISDATGQIVYANGAAENLFELSAGNPEMNTLGHLCPPLGEPNELLRMPIVPAKPFEAICVSSTGQAIEVLIGVAVLNPDAVPEARQIAAFIADLTLQKRSEELLRRTEKLAVAGRLAASIAHEINNPLEAITNLLYLVGTSTLEPEAREYLDAAQVELDRVAKITVQTLRFHRRSSRATDTDLPDALTTVLPLFDSRLRHIEAEVITRLRPTPKVLVYESEIRQVIANLIGNATDALVEKGRLFLRATPATHPVTGVSGVAVTVADTGSGIEPESLPKIFEPFFTTKGHTGTGLGLWVSLEIVERHEGTLRVRSRRASPGRASGTVFRLFLPYTSSAVEADREPIQ